ncbi:MAG: hypothetical protein AAF998_14535 [Bacteroidota bacterium]
MKTVLRTIFVLLLAGVSVNLAAVKTAPVKTGFEFLGQTLDSDYLTMDYNLPYGGMVELRIFTQRGKLVWRNQYINKRGDNRIRLKAEAFSVGSVYTIQLNYKTDVHYLNIERK